MAVSIPGISTLESRIGWVAGTASDTPWSTAATVKWLERTNSTGAINIDPATIDASALEDVVTKSIAGRAETGGTYSVTVNLTDDTLDQWEEVFESSDANQGVWIEEWIKGLTKAAWVYVQTPKQFPKPAEEQNALLTLTINLIIVDYKGYQTAIKPS